MPVFAAFIIKLRYKIQYDMCPIYTIKRTIARKPHFFKLKEHFSVAAPGAHPPYFRTKSLTRYRPVRIVLRHTRPTGWSAWIPG